MKPATHEDTLVFENGTRLTTLDGLGIRRQYHIWFKKDKTGPCVNWILNFSDGVFK